MVLPLRAISALSKPGGIAGRCSPPWADAARRWCGGVYVSLCDHKAGCCFTWKRNRHKAWFLQLRSHRSHRWKLQQSFPPGHRRACPSVMHNGVPAVVFGFVAADAAVTVRVMPVGRVAIAAVATTMCLMVAVALAAAANAAAVAAAAAAVHQRVVGLWRAAFVVLQSAATEPL